MKPFMSYLDFKDCVVELSSKGKRSVCDISVLQGS